MAAALLLSMPAAVHLADRHHYTLMADSTVTILRAARGQETVSVPGFSEPAGRSGSSGAARNASEFCPPPYHMTQRDGCQRHGQQ